jgi:hypothetical protein
MMGAPEPERFLADRVSVRARLVRDRPHRHPFPRINDSHVLHVDLRKALRFKGGRVLIRREANESASKNGTENVHLHQSGRREIECLTTLALKLFFTDSVSQQQAAKIVLAANFSDARCTRTLMSETSH